MRNRLLLAMGLIVGYVSTISAQQLPYYNHYFLNQYLINPAFAGISGYTDVMSAYRKQWVGIPDAPETLLLTVDWPIKVNKAGLGLMLYNDRTNIISQTGAYGSFSYKVNTGKKSRLFFGLSLGLVNTGIDFDRVRAQDKSESVLLNNPIQKLLFDGNAGMAFQYKKFRVGLAMFQLFQNTGKFINEYDRKVLNFQFVRHFNLSAEYSFELNNEFRLVPMALMYSVQGSNPQLELNSTLYYKKQYWINTLVRFAGSAAFTAGLVIDKRFSVSYSYEVPFSSNIRAVTSISHEIAIKYRFVKPNDRSKTGYEFIDNSITYFEEGITEEEKSKKAKPLPKKNLNK